MRVFDYLDYWARRSPDRVCASDGLRTVTWAQMRSWSLRIGHWLAGELDTRARFGVIAKNSLEVVAIYFGASRVGAVPVPLNTRLAPPEWAFILGDAGVELLIAEEEFADAIDGIREPLLKQCSLIGAERDGWRCFDSDVAAQSDRPVGRDISPDATLYQMYTSGTTGSSKGAVISHRQITANVAQLQTSLGRWPTKAMIVIPLFHAGGAVTVFFNAAAGTASRLVREFEPAEVIGILRDERIGATTLVPAMIQLMLAQPGAAHARYPAFGDHRLRGRTDRVRSAAAGARGVRLPVCAGLRHDRAERGRHHARSGRP